MHESAVTEYITRTFPEVETTTNFGYTFFSIEPIAPCPSRRSFPQTMRMIASRRLTPSFESRYNQYTVSCFGC